MTHLNFADCLTTDPFTNNNHYHYSGIRNALPLVTKDSENVPFILKSQGVGSARGIFKMIYCDYSTQLRSRLLNTKKIKDIMDSSKYPLLFRFKDKWYYIGKGFLAVHTGSGNDPKILFVACYNGKKPNVTSIEEIKFFVCRDIFNEEHKPLQPAVKDFINNHVGDVVVTNDVTNYVGEWIRMPSGLTLAEDKAYKASVVIECLTDVLRQSL